MYTLIPAKKIKKKQGKGGSPGYDTPSFLDPNMWIVIMHVNPNISTELHYKSTVWLVGVLFTLKVNVCINSTCTLFLVNSNWSGIQIIKFSNETFVHFCGKILYLSDHLKKRIGIRHFVLVICIRVYHSGLILGLISSKKCSIVKAIESI